MTVGMFMTQPHDDVVDFQPTNSVSPDGTAQSRQTRMLVEVK